MTDSIFLLGGRDLEMAAIAGLLQEHHRMYKDASLRWDNARLSCYQKEVEQYGNHPHWTIYGIELQEDIPVPANYVRIDHHNDYASQPSSLEQVAAILHHSLTRYQQLVAVNDRAYIPGMYQAGATTEEVSRIRREDRRAQGVTSEEEALAEKAIKENLEKSGELVIVKAYSSRFSPICDRLYPYKSLLVYSDDELMYYGEGVSELVSKYQGSVADKRFFHGGGANGYWGAVKGSLSPDEIKQLINEIKTI